MDYCVRGKQYNFYDLLKDNALKNEICFKFYEYVEDSKSIINITRKELLEKAKAIATELEKNKCKKGDRVIIFSTQTYDNAFSVVASMLVGSIFTIIPPPVDEGKIDRFISVVKSCEPKFILCTENLKRKFEGLLLKLKSNTALEGILEKIKIIPVDKCSDVQGFVQKNIDLDDVIYIQYSSGSTSEPKGVMVTYGNLLSVMNIFWNMYGLKRVFGWIPFFHNLGLVYLLLGTIINKEVVTSIMSPTAFLENPIRWIEGISEQKADATFAPNSVYRSYPNLVPSKMLEGKDIDLSCINFLFNGSEIVDYSAMKKFADEYKSFGIDISNFAPGYGLSETTSGVSSLMSYSKNDNLNLSFDYYKSGILVEVGENSKGDKVQFIPTGEIIPQVIIKIVNPETLEECAVNEFGEVWIQSPTVAKGYYNKPEETKETFKAKLKGYKGEFLRTGDLGIIKNNKLYITGRIKELIIVNGKNILPNDIIMKLEEEINELNLATIIPFSVVREGKEKLVVVLSLSSKLLNNEEIIDKINSCILKYFGITPYEIAIVDDNNIPKSDNGKISILATARLYNAGKLIKLNVSNKNAETKNIVYNTETEKLLGSIIKNNLNVTASRENNLLSLGLDSLAVVGLTKKIEEKFHISMPVTFIFSNPSIEKIGLYIDKSLAGEDLSLVERDSSFLRDEVKLDENIKPKEYTDDSPEMKNVFLTGSTGFLGAYIIRSLLETINAKVYCHVRAKSEEDGLKRIKENMQYYHLWKDKYQEYIVPVIGSLEKPLLGIDKEKYKYLTENIDTIYHNGAVLNFVYPYENLKEANVLGTVRTIALACEGKPKYYNYVSSYSVFDNPSYFNKEVSEDDPLEEYRGYYLSYSETKWVAENIIHIARQRGLRAAIYRPGEITGASDTGIWKIGDAVSRTIKSIIDIGVYPDIDMNMHMTQVDYVADAIVNISKKGKAYGKAYNLLNSREIPLSLIGQIINDNVRETKKIDYKEWKQNLFNASEEHPLKLLESLFKLSKKNPREEISCRYGKLEAKLSTKNADELLTGTGIKCEPMNEEIINKYLRNFI